MKSPLIIVSFLSVTTCFQPPHYGIRHRPSSLKSGYGITEDYTWKEEALEIELTVQVPPGTKGSDVHFKPGLTSIDLRVDTTDKEGAKKQVTLLDGSRKLRGRISLDGTYWVFSDRRRSITVTLEKYFVHSNDDMQVLDYDWKGLYPADEEEVLERKYDEPEVLNVREYASSLGVDVDNINKTLVDETMFSSGLNLTERALGQLTDSGYLTEITKQADGTEYKTNPETGEAEPFSFEDDGQETRVKLNKDQKRVNIPFLDTNSPWSQAVPVSVDANTNKTTITDNDQLRESLKQNLKRETAALADEDDDADSNPPDPLKTIDPIEQLTVKRLKEILRNQGLKVSGSKSELQERLRDQVNSLVQETKQKGKGEPAP